MAYALIRLLSGLLVDLTPDRERQGFPFSLREHMPILREANLIEIFIDPASQIGCFACLLRCHGFSFTANDATDCSRVRL